MTTSSGTEPPFSSGPAKSPWLDFAYWKSALVRGWKRVYSFFAERLEGLLEFVGQMIEALTSVVGSRRQLAFATSLALIFGGLGLTISRDESLWGSFWMAVGGFILGAVLPVPSKKN